MKKISFLLFLFFVNYLTIVKAQNYKIDSLKILLQNHTNEDTIKVNLLNEIASQYVVPFIKKKKYYAEKAFNLSKNLSYTKGMMYSLNYLGDYEYRINNYNKAIEYFENALSFARELEDTKQISYAMHNIGSMYRFLGNYEKSLTYLIGSIELSERIGDEKRIAFTLNAIGNIYKILLNYDKALNYYSQALNIAKKIDDKKTLSYTLNRIGNIYSLQGEYDKALEYFEKALEIAKEIDLIGEIAESYTQIAYINEKQLQYDKAIYYHQQALEINIKYGNKRYISKSYKDLANVYVITNHIEKAIQFANKSLAIAKNLNTVDIERDVYAILHEAYYKLEKYHKAYDYLALCNLLNDSIYSKENIRKIAAVEAQYQYEKEKQAAELEQQKKDAIRAERDKRQKVIRNSLFAGFILLLIIICIVLRNIIQKRKANFLLAKKNIQIEGKNKILLKKKEEIQNFANELEKANKTKDKFFSIIAHDLKSPFSALMGFSDLLLESHNEIDSKEREEYIRYINDGSIKTFKLLENLLTWAQSQTGKINYTPVEINTDELITEIIELLEEPANNKDIRLISNVEKELLLQADKNMLNTVIRNLVSNAIKFTPKGGEIRVNAQTIVAENNQKIAQISVKDSGVGIPPEVKSKLFKITENVSTKGTENESGTGLGLILCQEFVERHGGKIWVESEVGNGSEFLFTIPFLN